ncbi:MAG: 50S ribosomal protein L17 [Armatimonadota bacterium]|jgi:large subunit ribosomal protein L17|nr:50S ribosomal protein L17 [Armatimonadota bacterium]MDR7422972.1 50S ribosomal protein L17 [Armatimonadota bacterium]MDR7453999.1 50S ribosomal protein L17 [Armatimonadota bacterium]MDR7456872.1 50S ribosomal protein L17 [Armatimonadota bacterium]MDR7511874.1 50S ribosomal protein L17 [Armatimonadota bacterium]
MALGAKRRKLGRDSGERRALFRDLVSALILHDRIETTDAKARETKKIADSLISTALAGDIHARRQVRRVLTDRRVLQRLFREVVPRYQAGRGGYTRVLKTGRRRGDAAQMALVELVK